MFVCEKKEDDESKITLKSKYNACEGTRLDSHMWHRLIREAWRRPSIL